MRKGRATSAWTWCARRNGLANVPFSLPILCPAGVEPVNGVAEPGLCGGLLQRGAVLLKPLPYVGPGWYPKVSLAAIPGRRVNAMIGLWARSTEVVYSVRSSARTSPRPSHERDMDFCAEAAEQRHLPPHPRRGSRL